MLRSRVIWTVVSALIGLTYSMGAASAQIATASDGVSPSQTIPCAPPKTPKTTVRSTTTPPHKLEGTQNIEIHCTPSFDRAVASGRENGSDPSSKWLDFFRHLIEALAWPIVALVVAWRAGPELKKMIPALKKFKAGPLEVEFNEEIAALRQEVEAQFPSTEQPKTVSAEEARLLELAKVSPRSAIIEAWRALEIVAKSAVQSRTPTVTVTDDAIRESRLRSPVALASELGTLHILNAQQQSIYHELRYLRNQAAHAEDFETDFESANNYIQLTEALRLAIKRAPENMREGNFDL